MRPSRNKEDLKITVQKPMMKKEGLRSVWNLLLSADSFN